MKDGIVLFLAFAIVFGMIFFGVRNLAKKSYNTPQRSDAEIQARFEQKTRQQESLDDAQDRYRDAMRQQKQRIKDMQRK